MRGNTRYSKTEFKGFTHRFVVQFETGEPHFHTLQIYSNSGSRLHLEAFIEDRKAPRVLSFNILHRATKEQDEATAKFIDDLMSKD